jgi:subtilisin family serine protease
MFADTESPEGIGKAVANLSLGSLRIFAQSVNDAAAAAVDAGLFLAVAAGNDGLPALLSSPASEPSVCTVAATKSNDDRASFSNWGPGVDIFAPGVDVVSTWNNGSTAVLSGTSMATPHITGLGAYILTLEGTCDPIALCERLQALANEGVVGSALTTNNYLAYNGASSQA